MQKPLSEMTLQELWQLFPIQLKEYNPQYPQWYREKEAEVRRQLAGVSVVRISHIGSTAVEGLLSKPTVDILAELAGPAQFTAAKEALVPGGWVLMCEEMSPTPKLSFNQGYTPNGFAARVFHLHLRVVGDWGELYFRDYLQAEKAVAAQYAALKRGLQQQYEHDRDGYTAAKTAFVQQITAKARQRWPGKYDPQSKTKAEDTP